MKMNYMILSTALAMMSLTAMAAPKITFKLRLT